MVRGACLAIGCRPEQASSGLTAAVTRSRDGADDSESAGYAYSRIRFCALCDVSVESRVSYVELSREFMSIHSARTRLSTL